MTGPRRWYRGARFERYVPFVPLAALAVPYAAGLALGALPGGYNRVVAIAVEACGALAVLGWFVASLWCALILATADPAAPRPWYRSRAAMAFGLHACTALPLAAFALAARGLVDAMRAAGRTNAALQVLEISLYAGRFAVPLMGLALILLILPATLIALVASALGRRSRRKGAPART